MAASLADITILGLGIRGVDQVTPETEAAIRGAAEVLFVDGGIATADWLAGRAARVTALFEESYTEGAPRAPGYRRVAARVIEAALERAPVAFAMPGHPLFAAAAPQLIAAAGRALGLSVIALPGVSALDSLAAALMIDPVVDGLQMVEATDMLLRERLPLPDCPLVIWQIGVVETCLYSAAPSRPERFRRLRDLLLRVYPAEHRAVALAASEHPLADSRMVAFPLGEICARAETLDARTTLYVPPAARRRVVDADLLARLESPDHLRAITRQGGTGS